MIQQIHLQDSFLGAHGLHGKVLGAHQIVGRLLSYIKLRRHLRHQGLGPQVLGQAGLVLADAPVDEIHGLINGTAHIAVPILLLGAEQGPVLAANGQLHHTAVLLLHSEGHKCLGFLREVPIQLADLLLGIFLDGVVQRNFLTGKCELHVACSFPSVLCKKGEGSGRGFPLSLWALYHVAYCLKRCFAYFCG